MPVAKKSTSVPAFKPVVSPQERVAVRLGRLTFAMLHEMDQVLKPFGLTTVQYNALRILNGARPDGLCGTDLAARLVSKAPDVPRLLERMVDAGLIVRERDPENRRFVRARIAPAGVERLVESAPAVAAMHRRQWKNLTHEQIDTLVTLLDRFEHAA